MGIESSDDLRINLSFRLLFLQFFGSLWQDLRTANSYKKIQVKILKNSSFLFIHTVES